MGYLADKVRRYWTGMKDAARAAADLSVAIGVQDMDAALTAISHAHPGSNIYDDGIIRVVREYAKSELADPALLGALRTAIYENFDSQIPNSTNPAASKSQSGYFHPRHVYGMAAYLDDAEKLKELGAKCVNPDSVSNSSFLNENIILGCARLGAFEAMKEVIRQGASIDRGYGWDEYPPIHAFSRPLFHAFHPGVTAALLETGNARIIAAVHKALGPQYASCGKPGGPDLRR